MAAMTVEDQIAALRSHIATTQRDIRATMRQREQEWLRIHAMPKEAAVELLDIVCPENDMHPRSSTQIDYIRALIDVKYPMGAMHASIIADLAELAALEQEAGCSATSSR